MGILAAHDKTHQQHIEGIIAKASFLFYLFFIFFGTTLPFGETISEVEEIGTSNIVNQVVFASLFLASSVNLLSKRSMLLGLLKKEKYFSLLLLWCFLSITWSEFRFVSFKRFFQIATTVAVSISVLMSCRTSDDTVVYFKYILAVYISLSILVVIFVPGAIDPQTQTWRALASSKNHLGQACLVSILILLNEIPSTSSISRPFYLLLLFISIILLFGSHSMTAILTLTALAGIRVTLFIDDKFSSLGIGRMFSIFTITIFLGMSVSIFLLGQSFLGDMMSFLGKDDTFTGRTDLWLYMLAEVRKHLLLGCGFAGFWVVPNPNLLALYENFVWLPNHSHMGYLDILNEIGLIGLSLFAIMTLSYFVRLRHLRTSHFWKWFFIAALFINLQETTLFRQNVLTGVMFIFSYWALNFDLLKQEIADNSEIVPIPNNESDASR